MNGTAIAAPVPSIQIRPDTDSTDHVDNLPTKASANPRPQKSPTPGAAQDNDDAAWGSNFWVTLVDPQLKSQAMKLTFDVTISIRLPPSEQGEWWELSDDTRGGIPYYYQTKTGTTNTALGRRLSQTTRFSISFEAKPDEDKTIPHNQRSRQHSSEPDPISSSQSRQPNASRSVSNNVKTNIQRSYSSETRNVHTSTSRPAPQLTPIPGSDASAPSSPLQPSAQLVLPVAVGNAQPLEERGNKLLSSSGAPDSISRARAKSSSYISHRPQQPQSLSAALEKISASRSDSGHGGSSPRSPVSVSSRMTEGSSQYERDVSEAASPTQRKSTTQIPPSPRRPVPAAPTYGGRKISGPTVGGKGISGPIPNHAATLQMSPVKNRANGQPILVQPRMPPLSKHPASLESESHPALPAELVTDIQQFSESEFARQYFSTHRTGFIFRRKVPVTQMMAWQKALLNSPLLSLNRSLARNAVKMFKVIQQLMGDRERDKAATPRMPPDQNSSPMNAGNVSSLSLPGNAAGLLEDERWLLGEGLAHGELRDEIYCQLMKQLTGNPSTESVFKGWQLLCVALITFPPSKNFETYLSSFLQQHTTQHEGRVDVMAKYCLRRLSYISKKGPRGKPPTLAEIETASDAAFNPSTFGETLDGIIRLQERKYPQQKVPIILPFLADGILALGGLKSEGIFRVPGDADSVSELKLRIDRGYYTTDGVNDPHVLASLMKLWLRELCDPLVPEEMYNECITSSKDPSACVQIVERLPTINRRVVLFVVSFLQHFLEEKVQSLTKMTPANLALVMAPNLLRCNSELMSVVFTNAHVEMWILIISLRTALPQHLLRALVRPNLDTVVLD
ncbi:hypothetical protein DXG01_010136 [Tephrocybe rancida]|nr:hypothetical protein DXG01_010136 [Tephrocybe rancida]